MNRENYSIEDISIAIRTILNHYSNSEQLIENNKFHESNSSDMVFARLERAAFNQADKKSVSTLSRYGIWAADICQLTKEAMTALNSGDITAANAYLKLVHNATAAYIDIQALFDYINNSKNGFYNIDDIINLLNIE